MKASRCANHPFSTGYLASCLTVFLLLSTFVANPAHSQSNAEIVPGIHRIDRLLGSRPFDDLDPLGDIVGNAELVALGEAIHTSGSFYRMKLRLIQYLVEEKGFRSFGIESPWVNAQSTAQFVNTCQGTARAASRGLFGVWQSESMTDLLDWLCRFNQQHPNDPVVLFGFDHQQPDDDLRRLRPFLESIGLGTADPRVQALEQCHGTDGNLGAQPVSAISNQTCLDAVTTVEALLTRDEASIIAQTSVRRLTIARLHLIGLRAWQGQVFWRDTDARASTESRDTGMALALDIQRDLRAPGTKTILWAHNAHIAKAAYSGPTRWMGSHLAANYGNRYVAVGLVSYQLHIDWGNVGCGDWSTTTAMSVEGQLRTLDEPLLLVDLDFPGANGSPFFDATRVHEFGHINRLVPRDNFDALVYLDTSLAMRPTAWPPCGALQIVGTNTDPVLGCDRPNGHSDFCGACGPCLQGEGDCDVSSDCAPGLACAANAGPTFGLGDAVDVCVASSGNPTPPPPPGGCDEPLGSGRRCTACGPCAAGEGDCDRNSECQAGLTCVDNIGAQFGFAPGIDVCVASGDTPPPPPGECNEPVGTGRFCTTCGPCASGQGDCDSDAECRAGLTCVDNIGAQFGFAPGVDVCVAVDPPPGADPGTCPEPLGSGRYCTICGPCAAGEGDCDSDAECRAGLSCIDNVGAQFGFAPGVDVCG